jgi:hypothetical protein
MKNSISISLCLAGILLSTACSHSSEEIAIVAPLSAPGTPGGVGAGGLEKPVFSRACDGHDLSFLIALHGAEADPDFPGLDELPMLVASPTTDPVTPTRTQWIDTSDKNWSAGISREMDAISLGLDWLPFHPNTAPDSEVVVSWSPELPPAGFASIFYVKEGAIWAYSWGGDLKSLFPDDWSAFFKTETQLHSRPSLITPIMGSVRGVDFNGGFQGAWAPKLDCFLPPGAAPSEDEAMLFYSEPFGPLFASTATRIAAAGGAPLAWTWTSGKPVELRLVTDEGVVPLFPEEAIDDIVAFAYDRFHGIVMYSLADEDTAPFLVASVEEELSGTGLVTALVLSDVAPLLDHTGVPLGSSFSARPTGSCGIDPQKILGREELTRRLQQPPPVPAK